MAAETEPTLRQIAEFQSAWGYAPPSGACYGCGEAIYSTPELRRRATESVVTGCPHCGHSFID